MIPLLLALGWGCTSAPPRAVVMPPLAHEGPLRLVLVGDTGHEGATLNAVVKSIDETCAKLGCDLVVLLGDLLYPAGPMGPDDPRLAAVMDPFLALGLPLALVLGNHDWGRAHRPSKWAIWSGYAQVHPQIWLPAPTWSRDVGQVRLVAIDSDGVFWGGDHGESAFLDERLTEAGPRWRLVLSHHPAFSNGPHGNAGSYEGWSYLPYASGESLGRLYDHHVCGRADLLISGHDHLRQWISACGTEHLVSGAGSAVNPSVDRGNQVRASGQGPGWLWLSLGDTATLAFVDDEAKVESTQELPGPLGVPVRAP